MVSWSADLTAVPSVHQLAERMAVQKAVQRAAAMVSWSVDSTAVPLDHQLVEKMVVEKVALKVEKRVGALVA